MRKSVLVTGFLLLHALLFLPCTICTAQTATITGTVYENNQSQTTFHTPKGKLKINLPDDMRAGDMITGTVIAEPLGKDEKEQKKNLSELLKYKIYLPDGVPCITPGNISTTLLDGQVSFPTPTFTVPAGQTVGLELKTPDNKSVSTGQVPTFPYQAPPAISGQATTYTLAKKVVTNTEALVLLQSAGSGTPKLILSNFYKAVPPAKAESYTLAIIAQSPRKIVYEVPATASGLYNVCVQTENGKTKRIDLVNIIDINASIGKGNLLKGEQTQLSIKVTGLEGCPYRPVQLEISNKTPSVIQLAQGNQQLFPVDQPDNASGFMSNQPYSTSQTVIGQMIGDFIINTVLHIPPSAYGNPAQAMLDDISNPQEFNLSANALRSDIDNYLAQHDPGNITSDYLKQVKDNLPAAKTINNLEQVKAQTTALLNPLCAMPGGLDFLNQTAGLNKLHSKITAQMNVTQLVHPLHDLAGTFNTTTKQLHVNPSDKDALLQYLGAKQMDNGNYTFTLSDGDNPVVYADVVLRPNDVDPNDPMDGCGGGTEAWPPDPVPLSAQDVMPGAPVKPQDPKPAPNPKDNLGEKAEVKDGPKPVAGAGLSKADETKPKNEPKNDVPSSPAPKDTTKKDTAKSKSSFEWPGKGTTFKDSSGRKYEFYKNAECRELYSIDGNRCTPQMNYDKKNNETGKVEPVPTGNYEKWIFQSCRRCVKGTGFCTEMWQICSVQMVYSDPDCQNMIEVKNYECARCQ